MRPISAARPRIDLCTKNPPPRVEFSYLQDKSEYTPGNVILDPESGAGQIVERLCELEESSGLVERSVNHPEH